MKAKHKQSIRREPGEWKSEAEKLDWFTSRATPAPIQKAQDIVKKGGNPNNISRPDIFSRIK